MSEQLSRDMSQQLAGVKRKPRSYAAGELAHRERLTRDRLISGVSPIFSDAFVLADVVVDPNYRRRFDNFSGDLSGRYIGVLGTLSEEPAEVARLQQIVEQILSVQRPDGRFGRADLPFTAQSLDRQQMALLWGNGRLLVGLLEFNAAHPSVRIIASACRLAGFVERVCEMAGSDELIAKLDGAGAAGFICLTQCNEGLALLYQATGDKRWLTLCERVGRMLQPPGTQHSHGVLTTLRGRMKFFEITGDAAELAAVQATYALILENPIEDLVYGGVAEYFGCLSNSEVIAHSGEDRRDEGCSEADLIRLALQLWHATGEIAYLERAELCFTNHLLSNQFATGDFGHRVLGKHGFKPALSPARAWWCCTMHGLRAFDDMVRAAARRLSAEEVAVDLFFDMDWEDHDLAISTRMTENHGLRINVRVAPDRGVRIRIRQPKWAASLRVRVNGQDAQTTLDENYLVLSQTLHVGSTVEVAVPFLTRLVDRNREDISPANLNDSPKEAALFFGPWLMGISGLEDEAYYSEPWQNNCIHLPDKLPVLFEGGEPILRVRYIHDGYVEAQQATLRWVGGKFRNAGGSFAVWNRFYRGSSTSAVASS